MGVPFKSFAKPKNRGTTTILLVLIQQCFQFCDYLRMRIPEIPDFVRILHDIIKLTRRALVGILVSRIDPAAGAFGAQNQLPFAFADRKRAPAGVLDQCFTDALYSCSQRYGPDVVAIFTGIIPFVIFRESNCFFNKGGIRIFITPPIRAQLPFPYTRNWPQNQEIQKIFARSAIGLSLPAINSHFFLDNGYIAAYFQGSSTDSVSRRLSAN